jgi:hypothetical protein
MIHAGVNSKSREESKRLRKPGGVMLSRTFGAEIEKTAGVGG